MQDYGGEFARYSQTQRLEQCLYCTLNDYVPMQGYGGEFARYSQTQRLKKCLYPIMTS